MLYPPTYVVRYADTDQENSHGYELNFWNPVLVQVALVVLASTFPNPAMPA